MQWCQTSSWPGPSPPLAGVSPARRGAPADSPPYPRPLKAPSPRMRGSRASSSSRSASSSSPRPSAKARSTRWPLYDAVGRPFQLLSVPAGRDPDEHLAAMASHVKGRRVSRAFDPYAALYRELAAAARRQLTRTYLLLDAASEVEAQRVQQVLTRSALEPGVEVRPVEPDEIAELLPGGRRGRRAARARRGHVPLGRRPPIGPARSGIAVARRAQPRFGIARGEPAPRRVGPVRAGRSPVRPHPIERRPHRARPVRPREPQRDRARPDGHRQDDVHGR
jgi:hypothetical protein